MGVEVVLGPIISTVLPGPGLRPFASGDPGPGDPDARPEGRARTNG